MKELLSPYIGRGTWRNFEVVSLGGGVAKYEFGGGVGERKDMKHVKNMIFIFDMFHVLCPAK